MTPEAQRIAIAEACGCELQPGGKQGFIPDVSEHPEDMQDCPDYLNDLNAMHEAEKVFSNDQRRNYARMLFHVHPLHYDTAEKDPDGYFHRMAVFFLVHATAAQRAEAFLRTLSLWKD